MLQGESHVSRGQIRSLCKSTCHMSRQPERSHKKDNSESLGRLCIAMPVISIFCPTAMANASAAKTRYRDRGSPCLTPRSKVKKSEIVPLFIIQLWIFL